jgi:hypothetical protein
LPAGAATSFQRLKPKGFAGGESLEINSDKAAAAVLNTIVGEINRENGLVVAALKAAGVFEK